MMQGRVARVTGRIGAGLLLAAGALTGCGGASDSAAPDDLELPVAFGLTRDATGLSATALARSTPGDPLYGQWLTAGEIARYGAGPEAAKEVLAELKAAGLVGELHPTGGLIVGTLSVAEAQKVLGVDIIVDDSGAGPVAKPAKPPEVPRQWLGTVAEVVGLTLQLPPEPSGAPSAPASDGTTAPTCPPAPALVATLTDYYGLAPLHAAGRGGEGVTMGILQIDQTSQRALEIFERCYNATIPPVTTVAVDPSDPAVFGPVAEESTLDIVAASLIAPNLESIRSYQFNPRASIAFPLAAAIGDALAEGGPQIISTSIGVCELNLRTQALDVSEWLLAAGAAAGVTVIAAAGDTGSSACAPGTDVESSQYPASSTFVTGVGGTRFTSGPGPLTEQVWNDSPAVEQAGGGATVSVLPRPAYQQNLPGPSNRIVPDLAFIAAPATFGPIPVCSDEGVCAIKVVGGTSATSPGVAAAVSELADALAPGTAEPRRLGLLNPLLYSLAVGSDSASIFKDVTVGNNDLFGVGCCTAAPGYDPATGWGSVDFGALLAYYQSQG